MNNRSIVRAVYIQKILLLYMKTIPNNDSTYDYSGLFIDDDEL